MVCYLPRSQSAAGFFQSHPVNSALSPSLGVFGPTGLEVRSRRAAGSYISGTLAAFRWL